MHPIRMIKIKEYWHTLIYDIIVATIACGGHADGNIRIDLRGSTVSAWMPRIYLNIIRI